MDSAVLKDSSIIMDWQSGKRDGDGAGIFVQLIDPTGKKVDSDFQVNTTTEGSQKYVAIAAIEDGRFVIT